MHEVEEPTKTCEGNHDFLPGTVVAARRWFTRLEYAIFVCRRCGVMIKDGWKLG